ncbi:MAG TPA: monovalent cation/H(+) antiporter subunit G [Solirubrobacteraceae bacterium]|nr:monovalent cation/H(+) antiporter subunit G [Solirubrobacteraceae bacterium]
MRTVVVDVFLWLAVALSLICCVGLLVAPTALDRLHFLGPSVLAGLCLAVAVVVQNSFSLVGDQTILVAVLLGLCSPVLTHAAARAARAAGRGTWRPGSDDVLEMRRR